MKFGSTVFFTFMKESVAAGAGERFWDVLYRTIADDTRKLIIRAGVALDSIALIHEKVFLTVQKKLALFLIESENNTEQQRNAWLIDITKKKIMGYYRDRYNFFKKNNLSLSELGDLPDTDKGIRDINEMRGRHSRGEEVCRLIAFVCDMNTSPEKIIAFFYNKVIVLLRSNKHNGAPSQVSGKFKGVSLGELAAQMKKELREELQLDIPEAVFSGLDRKLCAAEMGGSTYRDSEFGLSPREITDSSSWIAKKARDSKEYIIGGAAE